LRGAVASTVAVGGVLSCGSLFLDSHVRLPEGAD
jgi:hypothetical protein